MSEGRSRNEIEEFPRDVVFRLLSHVHRRGLINCLDRHDEPLALADAATEVARECTDRARPEPTEAEVTTVRLSLYHVHVPRLVEENVLAYDRERDSVALTERGRQFAVIQERLASTDW